MFLTLLAFQLTMGSYFFVYVQQIACETQNSVVLTTLWTWVLVLSLSTSYIISGFGVAGTFGAFSVTTLLGGVYLLFRMKETDGLTTNAQKQLFFPDEFKTPPAASDYANINKSTNLDQRTG
jgi:hypothetical protein